MPNIRSKSDEAYEGTPGAFRPNSLLRRTTPNPWEYAEAQLP